jgi:hypothetical protein
MHGDVSVHPHLKNANIQPPATNTYMTRDDVESLSHLMFDCPATSAQRDTMFDDIRSVLRDVAGGAEKLGNVLSLPDASTKLLRFVSDDVWGSRGVCRVISRSIAEYLVQAWDVRNSCKHNGAVLPPLSAPEGRGADGVDAMA